MFSCLVVCFCFPELLIVFKDWFYCLPRTSSSPVPLQTYWVPTLVFAPSFQALYYLSLWQPSPCLPSSCSGLDLFIWDSFCCVSGSDPSFLGAQVLVPCCCWLIDFRVVCCWFMPWGVSPSSFLGKCIGGKFSEATWSWISLAGASHRIVTWNLYI